jgi:Uma2 family endonuclease
MTVAAWHPAPVTIAQFDRLLEVEPDEASWELIDGEIVAMTNPTQAHEDIAMNIGARLRVTFDHRGCSTYVGNMRVQRSADATDTMAPRPDVLLRCGEAEARTYVTDPIVVVEVLSRSTMDRDRGPKLQFYKTLDTVKHIVFAYQDQMRVEHYHRAADGQEWEIEVLTRPDEVLRLGAVDFEIGLDVVYLRVPLDRPPPRRRP